MLAKLGGVGEKNNVHNAIVKLISTGKSLDVNAGPVVIYLTGSGNVLSLAGNAEISNNTLDPTKLIFMCTSSTTPQSISVVGNGNAYFAIYCPKANITITGNGAIFGAVVGKSVSWSGNNGFVHYDKALATFNDRASGAIKIIVNP